MSSDNRTPRLHSFRIACAIASATLCATAIAQVAFSLKPAIEVLDNPVIADSPRIQPLRSRHWSLPSSVSLRPSSAPFSCGRSRAETLQERVCDMLEGARHSLRCSSCHQPLRRLTQNLRFDVWRRGAVGAQEIASSFDWTSLVLGIVLFMLSQLFLYARGCTSTPTRLRKETPCP